MTLSKFLKPTWPGLALCFLTASVGCSSSSATSNDAGTYEAGTDSASSVDGAPVIERDAQADTGFSCSGSAGVSFGTDVCNACMDAHCCDAINACFSDSDCSDLADCITSCKGDAGVDASAADGGDAGNDCTTCRMSHAASTAKYDAVVSCQASSCESACK